MNASPVILEDDVLVGGNSGVYEGTIVRRGAVLAAGTILTRGTPVFDLVNGTTLRATAEMPLIIPENAVMVPGSRAVTRGKGAEWGLSLYAPVIVKYRDEKNRPEHHARRPAALRPMTDNEAATKVIRWGVAGPGRAAVRFAQGLAAVPDAQLAAVWGRTPERAEAYAERFAVPQVCGSMDELAKADIDAIYVATHPDTHAELCLKALTAGRQVMCEKPAALNVRQLRLILKARAANTIACLWRQ